MEKHYCVVIIGAGIAGLSCGKYLIENDIKDFVIIEANDQIGGRCQTIQYLEHQIELGAEILHGTSSSNPLYQLAEENQLIEHSDHEFDCDHCYHDENGESIDDDIINEIERIYDEILQKQIPTYPYEHYPDVSLGEFLSTELDQYLQLKKSSFDKDELYQRKKVIKWFRKQHPFLNMISCEKLTDVSVQGWNSFEHLSKDDLYTTYIQGGFINFLEKFFLNKISKEKIELNSVVKRMFISEDDGYVNIEIIRNNQEIRKYQAKHVVCTQSIGCLKQTMNEMFIPLLPHSKRMCIEKLAFGTINKIYLIFSQPFWDVDFNRFNFIWSTNSKWKLNCLEHTSYDSQWCKSLTGCSVHHSLSNILVTELSGDAGKYTEIIPDDLLINCFQEIFSRFYPDYQIPKPNQLIRSQWSNKSFIYGTHTFIKIGSSIHDIKQLAIPWVNKSSQPLVLFAGEGTHERFYGTAHGAFMTGIREAKRIVQLYKKNL